MKKLFSLYKLAVLLDKFKIAHQGIYLSIGAALVWIEKELTDPKIIQMINHLFPGDDGWMSTIAKIIPMIAAILISPRTQKRIDAGPNGL